MGHIATVLNQTNSIGTLQGMPVGLKEGILSAFIRQLNKHF